MKKKQFLFMFDARPTLPPQYFSTVEIGTYESNIEKWFRMMCDEPPYKPGRKVRCICGFWGPDRHGPVADYHKGWTARVLSSAWDYKYGPGGHENVITATEHDALYGYTNSFHRFYEYDLLFDKNKDRQAWWKHEYLEPVSKRRATK